MMDDIWLIFSDGMTLKFPHGAVDRFDIRRASERNAVLVRWGDELVHLERTTVDKMVLSVRLAHMPDRLLSVMDAGVLNRLSHVIRGDEMLVFPPGVVSEAGLNAGMDWCVTDGSLFIKLDEMRISARKGCQV